MMLNNNSDDFSWGKVGDQYNQDYPTGGNFRFTLCHANELNFPNPGKLSKPLLKKFTTLGVATTGGDNSLTYKKDDSEDDLIEHYVFRHGYKSKAKLTTFETMFPCKACSEVFYLKSGLDAHMNRETVAITFSCSYCCCEMTFSNRCLLLDHLLGHQVTPTITSLKGLISFLPLKPTTSQDYRIQQSTIQTDTMSAKEVQINWPTSEETENCQPPLSPVRKLAIISSPEPAPVEIMKLDRQLNVIISLLPQDHSSFDKDSENNLTMTNSDNSMCLGCEKIYSKKDFFPHVREAERNAMSVGAWPKSFSCDLDHVPSYSSCGHQFHNRLFHEKLPPFTCPECGEVFINWELLEQHARHRCCHFSKLFRYNCPASKDGKSQCSFHSLNLSSLNQHFESDHSRKVSQCIKCSNAFASENWLINHLSQVHGISNGSEVIAQSCLPNVELTEEVSRKLIQCMLCAVVFYTNANYQAHLNDHYNSSKIVFFCKFCSLDFSSGKGLFLHKQKVHLKLPIQKIIVPSEQILRVQIDSIADQSSKIKDASISPEDKSLSPADPAPTPPPKPYFCTICSDKGFYSMPGLKKHLRVTHQIVDFATVDMKAMIKDPVEATLRRRRLKQNHKNLARQRRLAYVETETIPKDPTPIKKSKLFETYKNINITEDESLTLSEGLATTAKFHLVESRARLTDGTFRCLKCPKLESFPLEPIFLAHVKLAHNLIDEGERARRDENYDPYVQREYAHDEFWCPECGIEFIVKPSLLKHLICAHEFVKDTKQYLIDIGYGLRPVKALAENQCKVCYHQCEDSIDYESHIRTHGMAFLRLRKQRITN